MLDKKALTLPWATIIKLILLLISVGFIFTFILQSKLVAEEVIPDDIARLFVKVKCGMKEKTMNILSAPLPHSTKSRELPLKGNKKEDFMRDLNSLVASCWYQFNDGNTCDDLWDSFISVDFGKRDCFICYTFDMKELKDTDKVTDTEFHYWMNTNLKLVEEADDNCYNQGGYCTDDEDTFRSNYRAEYGGNEMYFNCKTNQECKERDQEKDICCFSRYSCLNKGGRCEDKDFLDKPENKAKYKKYNTWRCPGGKECFVDAKNYYTHLDYVQRYGESGNLFITNPDFQPHSNIYAVTFINKVEKEFVESVFGYLGPGLIKNYFELFKNEQIPTIIISKLDDIENHCKIERDIKGR